MVAKIVIAYVLGLTALLAQEQDSREKLVEQWMKTELQVSKEAAAWNVDKAHTQTLLRLYKKELELLNDELDKVGEVGKSVDQASKELKSSLAVSESTRKKVIEYVVKLSSRVLTISKHFPGPLQDQLVTELGLLVNPVTNENVREALRSTIKVLQEAERFDRVFNVQPSQALVINGEKYRAKVMYFGLSMAVYKAGGNYGVGKPTANGWEWSETKELNKQIETCFAVQEKQTPSKLFKLSLQVKEVKP